MDVFPSEQVWAFFAGLGVALMGWYLGNMVMSLRRNVYLLTLDDRKKVENTMPLTSELRRRILGKRQSGVRENIEVVLRDEKGQAYYLVVTFSPWIGFRVFCPMATSGVIPLFQGKPMLAGKTYALRGSRGIQVGQVCYNLMVSPRKLGGNLRSQIPGAA